MPSAQRRARQRLARERSAAMTSAAATLGTADQLEEEKKKQKKFVCKATQTLMDAQTVQSILQSYWARLDRMQVDQATEPVQFIIGCQGGLTQRGSSQVERIRTDEDYKDYDEYMYWDDDASLFSSIRDGDAQGEGNGNEEEVNEADPDDAEQHQVCGLERTVCAFQALD